MVEPMKKIKGWCRALANWLTNKLGFGMRAKLISVFLLVKVIPILIITIMAWHQFIVLGDLLRDIAVTDSSEALNASAVENIERMTTDTADRVAKFLYARDSDLMYLASIAPSDEAYKAFSDVKTGPLIQRGSWALRDTQGGERWVEHNAPESVPGGASSNAENNDRNGWSARGPEQFRYRDVPLYDEISYIDLTGQEVYKYVSPNSPKTHYPMSGRKRNISARENTYVRAETYWAELKNLKPGEIYVSDVTGAYVGSNYIGMYVPTALAKASQDRGYDILYDPTKQAYAGEENPDGQRFEGIVRWATPVAGADGQAVGYVSFALNHDHIMEFVDHQTPMNERYSELPSAFEGNYAFIWDYKCRNICHPRHHSIVGFDPETGEPQIPWLESSIYDGWRQSGIEKWTDYVKGIPLFDTQSRDKKPALALTAAGLVGLDGRYLNNAPQCTGWMDLTENGGSGSFYILWSGLYKLTTAAAIPYYTGRYAPSEANNFSKRGFGIVTIGAGLDDFTRPATQTEVKLQTAITDNLRDTFARLILTTLLLIVLVVLIAIWMASSITGNITRLIKGISRFRAGERQFRFRAKQRDEFGTLADSFDDMADSIVDSVKGPLSITDMNERIIYMNDAGLALCKMTLQQIVGASYAESSVYPVDSKYYPIKALREGREAEIYFEATSGRYLRGSASYLLNKDCQRIGYIIVSSDVTEMVLKQQRIEEQRTLLDQIFSASPDLIWYKDPKGVYLAVNPRFASIVNQPIEAFLGKTAQDMLPAALAERFVASDQAAIAQGAPQYTSDKITFADGHEEILDSVRTPIHDQSGQFVGLLNFARNVDTRVRAESELRQTQLELERAVSDANRANEAKGEFLARMSHEIRTPMNAIIGLTNIVQRKLGGVLDGELSEVKDHVRQIEVSSQHLLGLLNDILDISKIEAGKIELTEEVMELPKLLQTVASIIQPRCDEKNISFVTRFESMVPGSFLGDSLRLRQVLINLLGNAVKFTPELGQIDFAVARKARKDGKSLIEFSVKDNGIGINQDTLATIFQPFEQANNRISRQYGGTGLGLSISRRIVQLFGGDIEVVSKPGAGSEFRFALWLLEVQADAPDTGVNVGDATGKFRNSRVLLVDDVDINRMIVASLLESTGIQIDEAADGLEALEKFQASPEGGYDIILMDVQMPNMDGYEATRAIRALPRADAQTVPVVALTANAFKEDIDEALGSGMNAHLTKPVDMDKLVELLFRYIRPSAM